MVREEKKEKKKKEKKKKKKQDDDEDELDKMLEELALEIEGKKPPPSKDAPAATPAGDEVRVTPLPLFPLLLVVLVELPSCSLVFSLEHEQMGPGVRGSS